MSDSTRISGDRVYCHVCEHEWNRSQGGLQCPECASEFVEVVSTPEQSSNKANVIQLEHGSRREQEPTLSPPPIPPRPSPFAHPFHDHDPWAHSPVEDDTTTTFGFNNSRGRGTFTFTSRTYTVGGNQGHHDPEAEEIARNFAAMFSTMLSNRNNRPPVPMMGGGIFPFPQTHRRGFGDHPSGPADPFSMLFGNPTHGGGMQASPNPMFDILGMLLNPGSGRTGDMVMSQEEFDQVMTRLMDQNQGNGAPPASEIAIRALQKKKVDKKMMGSDGKAECSICMDNVEIDDEVTILPCNHWFHGDCIISWLKEHDTCPHCRKPISNPEAFNEQRSRSSSRRHTQRGPATTSPIDRPPSDDSSRYGPQVADSSRANHSHNRYYSNTGDSDLERPSSEHNSGSRSDRDTHHGGGGGVGGWFRSLRPFS